MLALGCGIAALPVIERRGGGGTPAPSPTVMAAPPDFGALGLTPDFAYHPNTAAVTKDGSNQLTGVTGTVGASPDLAPSAAGPLEIAASSGVKAWRFRGTGYLDLPKSFTSSPKALTVFMVQRTHKAAGVGYIGHRYAADGTTPLNTAGPFLGTSWGGGSDIARLRSAPRAGTSFGDFCVSHQNLCLVGAASNAARMRLIRDDKVEDFAAYPYTDGAMQGLRLGGYLFANGNTNTFDLYYAVGFKGALTDAQVAAIQSLLIDWAGIETFTQNVVLEGDSITYGSGLPVGESMGMFIAEPGRGLLPANVRVLDAGIGGNQIADLVNRRDGAHGWPVIALPGGAANNRLYGQIGRNDMSTGGKTGAQIYASIVSYLNTASTGLTARGWSAYWAVNIATSSALLTPLTDLRALLRSSLLADTAASGLIELPLITSGASGTIFDTPADASDIAWYQGDVTHPSLAGMQAMVTGADTPQFGYGARLT